MHLHPLAFTAILHTHLPRGRLSLGLQWVLVRLHTIPFSPTGLTATLVYQETYRRKTFVPSTYTEHNFEFHKPGIQTVPHTNQTVHQNAYRTAKPIRIDEDTTDESHCVSAW